MTKHPDGGMYGIKLIHPLHLLYREFTEVRDGTDGKYPLMNFNISRKSQAANIPVGHRSIVFVTKKSPHWGRLIWAVEFVGTLEEGDQALVAWGHPAGKALPGNPPALPPVPPEFSLHRPIRFLACVDPPENGPRLEEVRARSQFDFTPNAYTHKYLTREDYRRAFGAIAWTWLADGDATPAPPSSAAAFIDPPVPDPSDLLRRIREVRGMPERNVEDVVKFFMTQLGHEERNILFQIGHVDVLLSGAHGEALAVVEVKRALDTKTIGGARRQAFDYAMKVGARLVIVSDADVYHVWDRDRGKDYTSTNCGEFQLTRLSPGDRGLVDLLRPPGLEA